MSYASSQEGLMTDDELYIVGGHKAGIGYITQSRIDIGIQAQEAQDKIW